MIDILPTSRSAIFTDAAPRKLPRSFYWGAGFAVLLHAGLVYYLVAQNFTHTLPADPPVTDHPMVITVDTPPPPQPQPQAQKPVSHVMVHTPQDTPATPPETLTFPPNPQLTPVTDGPPKIEPPLVTTGTEVKAEPGPVTPHWKAFPDAATLTDYYPPRALDNEMEGTATVQCTVLDTAGRVHCVLVSESPKGYSFGAQTVKMVEEKGRVDTAAGDIKPGSVLAATTVKWQLN